MSGLQGLRPSLLRSSGFKIPLPGTVANIPLRYGNLKPSQNLTYVDAVTYNVVPASNAYYIAPRKQNGTLYNTRVYRVYALKTIKELLKHGLKDPYTGRVFTHRDVYKLRG